MLPLDCMVLSPLWVQRLDDYDRELRAIGRPQSTRHLRSYQLRRFASDYPDRPPESITRDDIVDWFARVGWKASTRRSYRSALRGFFGWMLVVKRIDEDPTATLPIIRLERSVPTPATDESVNAASDTDDERLALMIEILAHSGTRRGELAKIKRTDVVRGLTQWTLRVTGKGGHTRVLPIPDHLAAWILACPDGYLFPSPMGGHLTPAHVGKLVSRAMGEYSAHNVRHRYATVSFRENGDIVAVQRLLGHAKIDTTMVYVEVANEQLRQAAASAGVGLVRRRSHAA